MKDAPSCGHNRRIDARSLAKKRRRPSIKSLTETILAHVEAYATIVFFAVFTDFPVSELVALKWEDIHADSITVDERYCRGDWGCPKNESSNATVP